jgi:hypothetical protein
MTGNQAQGILSLPPIDRVRRNHGLEHATLHILAQRHPKISLAGHSDTGGYWILGNLTTEEVQSAAEEALERLRNGERSLAVHPYCGTNFATAGILAGVTASLAMLGAGRRFRDKLERLPLAVTLATLALMLAQPLGALLQEQVTTSGRPDGLEILRVVPKKRGKITVHRVATRG